MVTTFRPFARRGTGGLTRRRQSYDPGLREWAAFRRTHELRFAGRWPSEGGRVCSLAQANFVLGRLMAGRIRTLKPEILENARTAALSSDAFRLFIGMILLADDQGNLTAEPARLEGAVFWARAPREPVAILSRELREADLIGLYRVRGLLFASVTGWAQHQRIDRPGRARVPTPDQADADHRDVFASESRSIRASGATDLRPPTSDLDHDHDREITHPRARDGAAPSERPAQPPKRCTADLGATWLRIVGLPHTDGLVELAIAVESAALAQAPPADPDALFVAIVTAFVAWVDGIRTVSRRPQKSPRKCLEHLARLLEIAAGKREAVPPPDLPSSRRGSAAVSDWTGVEAGEEKA